MIKFFFKRRPTLTPVYVKDEASGGYTIYFREYPSVVSQGKSKSEALYNLHVDFVASLEMQKRHAENTSISKREFA
jgi:hypothetical protein